MQTWIVCSIPGMCNIFRKWMSIVTMMRRMSIFPIRSTKNAWNVCRVWSVCLTTRWWGIVSTCMPDASVTWYAICWVWRISISPLSNRCSTSITCLWNWSIWLSSKVPWIRLPFRVWGLAGYGNSCFRPARYMVWRSTACWMNGVIRRRRQRRPVSILKICTPSMATGTWCWLPITVVRAMWTRRSAVPGERPIFGRSSATCLVKPVRMYRCLSQPIISWITIAIIIFARCRPVCRWRPIRLWWTACFTCNRFPMCWGSTSNSFVRSTRNINGISFREIRNLPYWNFRHRRLMRLLTRRIRSIRIV